MTWVSGVNGERGLIDYICIRKKIRDRLLDVNVLRGSARGISDHFLVLAKIRVKGGWRKIGCSGRGSKDCERGKIGGKKSRGTF